MSNPNINLRVFRRDTTDMTLIYNSLELSKKVALKPYITIENKEITYFIDDGKVKDSSRGDVFLFIPYFENKLNESDKYIVKISFGNELTYAIEIEPKGMLPNLKDDIKKVSQVMGYDNKIKRWVKLPLTKTEDKYHLEVNDEKNSSILLEILKELKSINSKVK